MKEEDLDSSKGVIEKTYEGCPHNQSLGQSNKAAALDFKLDTNKKTDTLNKDDTLFKSQYSLGRSILTLSPQDSLIRIFELNSRLSC